MILHFRSADLSAHFLVDSLKGEFVDRFDFPLVVFVDPSDVRAVLFQRTRHFFRSQRTDRCARYYSKWKQTTPGGSSTVHAAQCVGCGERV